MRSFIATGHFVPIYVQTLPDVVGMVSSGSGSRAARLSFYRQHQLVPPRNYMIGRMGSRHSLRVVFYEVDRGLLLIQAPSIHGAYDVLRAVQAFFCLAGGHGAPVDRDFDALIEVNKIPKPSWSASDLMMNIRQGNVLGVLGIQSLSDGIAISAEEMQHILRNGTWSTANGTSSHL